MRDEFVVATLAGIALLLIERIWEIGKSIRDTRRERSEWIAFLDEWLSGSVGTCREVRTGLLRYLKPWHEFERVIAAGQGTADAPEFPMIRLERPDVEQVVATKYPLLRPAIDPLLVLRINGTMRLIRYSLDAVTRLSVEVAMGRDRLRTELALVQTIVGEIQNGATEAGGLVAIARKLPKEQFPKTTQHLDEPDENWTRFPPLTPGTYECRPAGTSAPPTRVLVIARTVETPHGTVRLLRTPDGKDPVEAFSNHEWREPL